MGYVSATPTQRTLLYIYIIESSRITDISFLCILTIQVHDPIKDTLIVPDDHSFGVFIKPDEYGAGDLIHMRNSENILRGKDYDRGKLAFVRQQLKKANFHNFHSLKAAFEFYDKHRTGKITNNDLMEVSLLYLY